MGYKMRNVSPLPNGRIVVSCLDCGYKHDLSKYGWSAVVCQSCRKLIKNPIKEPNREELNMQRATMTLSKNSRDYIHTVAALQEVSKTAALETILHYSSLEYKLSGGKIMEEPAKAKKKKVER